MKIYINKCYNKTVILIKILIIICLKLKNRELDLKLMILIAKFYLMLIGEKNIVENQLFKKLRLKNHRYI